MNPQQYYQMAASSGMTMPGGQGVPGPPATPYMATQPYAGGMHVAIPPPPLPNAYNLAASKPAIHAVPKLPESISMIENQPMETSEKNSAQDKDVAAQTPELKLSQASLSSSTNTTTAVSDATLPTPVVLPSSSQAAAVVGGVYAGAYFHQAIPAQQPASTVAAHSQYMMTTPGAHSSVPVQQNQKLMYIPHNGAGMAAGSYYVPQGPTQPTIFTDQAGKPYVINSPYQAQVQYQVGPSSLVKVPAQQYVVAAPQLYNPMPGQAPAPMQPMYGRMHGLPTAQVPALGTVPGVAHNPVAPTTPAPQVYYYYH